MGVELDVEKNAIELGGRCVAGIDGTSKLCVCFKNKEQGDEANVYNFTKSLWRSLAPPRVELLTCVGVFAGCGLEMGENVLTHGPSQRMNKESLKCWTMCFFVIIWVVWGERNNIIFRGEKQDIQQVVSQVMLMVDKWKLDLKLRNNHHSHIGETE
ncbi:hypothetical protein PIB30_081936 [Stylosanthes scabra]|uniref:Uncharacterized protein n=1 Tax=Stylosanthes scabra TaxID=79078 RepID=A0ABU6XRW6_9FABA|nr:hypothetical protein [Stylosanthes scabra]